MGIMAVAGLVIDMGMVLLTRREMQVAVNTAALEGLRNDRQAASDLAASVFIDPNGQIPFGAGPVGNPELYQGGIPVGGGNYHASQTLQTQAAKPYQPSPLNTNPENNADGDIVVGQYQGDFVSHVEDSSYARADFNTGSSTPDSVLVRMRRSMEQQNGTLSSGATGGSPVPTLFSRGDPLLLYNGNPFLANGVTVRATAIAQWKLLSSIRNLVYYADPTAAQANPGLSQLPPPSQQPTASLLPLALTTQFWTALTDQSPNPQNQLVVWTTVSSSEIRQSASISVDPSMTYLITYTDPNLGSTTAGFSIPLAVTGFFVGELLAPAGALPTVSAPGVAPIVTKASSGAWVVVGFAYIVYNPSATVTRYQTRLLPGWPQPVSVTHPTQNASASFSALTTTEAAEIAQGQGTAFPDAMASRSTSLVTDTSTGNALPSASYLLSSPVLVRTVATPLPQN